MVHTKTYVFPYFYRQYLVLCTMAPGNNADLDKAGKTELGTTEENLCCYSAAARLKISTKRRDTAMFTSRLVVQGAVSPPSKDTQRPGVDRSSYTALTYPSA